METEPEPFWRTVPAGAELNAAIAAEFYRLPVVWSTPPYAGSERWGYDPNARYPWLKGLKDGCNYDWAHMPKYSTD